MNKGEILKIIKEAGEISLKIYRESTNTVYKKIDNSPVTEADFRVHKFLLEKLESSNIPIMSEEGSKVIPDSEYLWVIDPIDGTKDFIQKTKDYSIMVALLRNGKPVMSVVYAPVYDELYFAEIGKGSYVHRGNTKAKLNTSEKPDFKGSTIVVSRNHGSPEIENALEINGIIKRIEMGSIGVKFGKIAKGEAEIYVNEYTKLGWWDVCAPQLILEEAGGKVTGIQGEEILYKGSKHFVSCGLIASNGKIHDKVKKCISSL